MPMFLRRRIPVGTIGTRKRNGYRRGVTDDRGCVRRWAVPVLSGALVCVLTAAIGGCAQHDPTPQGSSAVTSSVSAVASSSAATGSAGRTMPTVGSPAPTPTVDPLHGPPYIDHVQWVQTQVGPSLQIYPTSSGRQTTSTNGAVVAWAEVLALAPGADTPGMRAQFDCHWTFARAVAPDKPSWNIEPERPVVDAAQMVATRCNPGGPEE